MERKSAHSNRDGLLLRSESSFVLQWGSRKRLRCMKVHAKDPSTNNDPTGSRTVQRATARVDRRAVRSGINISNSSKDSMPNQLQSNSNSVKSGIAHLNLRQRPSSPSRRILRNSEGSIAMKRHSNGVRGLASPDRKVASNNNNHNNSKHSNINHYNNDNHHGSGGSGSSEIAHDGKRSGSPGGGDTMWPPKFVIALTNKEKEEDFMAIKGSKLPQRPKKRAKFIQRTLNLVSPGAWLCDLTLERYEVREKKVSKMRPRGLKAMGNVESDSE
ncbi:hypothetical protein PHJA_002160400 [Phtheirospermum japonicum]|uniref:Uncharacterized protein n=1 Tax=Phtheirospermum japonicum TaxID=374723 RepID=A0A830CWD8_9LAMI|nr:hypothetical protein PHJA_002160400 [Phtheirospermum japonicum]